MHITMNRNVCQEAQYTVGYTIMGVREANYMSAHSSACLHIAVHDMHIPTRLRQL